MLRPAAALVTLALLSAPARAEERPDVDLRWSVSTPDPACPDEAHLRAAVERLTGRPLQSPHGPRLPVRVDAAQAEGGAWTVRIAIARPGDPAPRERRIEGPTCPEVAEAAAVVVAVALAGPGAALGLPAPAPAPAPPSFPLLPAASPAEEPPPDAPDARSSKRAAVVPGLRLAAGADYVSLPAPTFGGEVALRLAIGDHRVELFGSAWLPRAADSTSTAMASAQISLYAGGARYCHTIFGGTFDLEGCGGLEAGALLGVSQGVTHPGNGVSPWVAPSVGLIGGWAFARRFRLVLALSGLLPVVRDSFQIRGLGQLYRPAPVTARSLIGLEASFR